MAVREYGPNELPDLARYSGIPLFNTKAVVQQTGVQAPTLRAWERRYALLSPERAGNAYRLYSERDIATIRWLKSRVDSGMAISQAVALFRHMLAEHQQVEEAQQAMSAENPSVFQVAFPQTPPLLETERRTLPPSAPRASTDGEGQFTAHDQITYTMFNARQQLVEAFTRLDEASASMLTASLLTMYPVEQVCSELIVPVMWQVGQLWEEGKVTVAVEHFASNFIRGVLTNLFHIAPGSKGSSLVLVCCAPYEAHEIAPLMLALCLRRAGLHVAYLGQSIETAGLLHTIKELMPLMVCVSLTIPAHLPSLIDLAQRVPETSSPPIFAFGGQVFARYPQLIAEVPGQYVHGDLIVNVDQLRRMVEPI
jgi:DNA-binding transcriptional MerR regulator